EEAVVGGDQVVDAQDTVEVVACLAGTACLGVVDRPQLALDLAAHALEGTRGDDALRGAADAHGDVDGVGVLRGGDGAGDVTVTDETDLGACAADVGDELDVARAVQHDDGHIGGGDALGLGHGVDVVGDRGLDVHDTGGLRADGDLVHVEHRGWVVHGVAVS